MINRQTMLKEIEEALARLLTGVTRPLTTGEVLDFLLPDKDKSGRAYIGKLLVEEADTTLSRFCFRGEPELQTKGFAKGRTIRRVFWRAPKKVCAHCDGTGFEKDNANG